MTAARAVLTIALAAAIGAGAAAAEAPAPSAPRLRIALEPLKAPALSAALVAAVEEQLCADIAKTTGAEVVCPGDIAAATEAARQAAIHGQCATDECLRRVDAMKDADRRVSGAIERGDGGVLVLSLQVVDQGAAGGRIVEKLPEDLDRLFSRLPGAVRKLFPPR